MVKRLTGLYLLVAIAFSGCEKQNLSDCHQARVIRVTCASVVMQSTDNNSLGEDNWVDIMDNNKRYDNVFSVSNTCRLPSGFKTHDTLFVRVKNAVQDDCVRCALYDAAPAKSLQINDYSSVGCSGAKE